MVIAMKKCIKYIICIMTIIILFISTLSFLLKTPPLEKNNYIEIYDKNNNLIYSELYNNPSKYVDLEFLNKYTYEAFIAIEDKDFYNHKGFDIQRTIQAFFINLFSFSIKQGASTITQQYARNTLLSNKRTLSRKIKEAFYTIQIERDYTKEQILEGYLNSLYFGHGLTGIYSASMYYFGKEPQDLTIAESAMLAGVCNAPSIYSPYYNNNKAIQRQRLVLYEMFIQDYIDESEYQKALKEKLIYSFSKEKTTNFDYHKDSIINELTFLNLDTKENLHKGLKIYTTSDYSLTKEINNMIQKYTPSNKDTQISIVIMEPFTNNVLYLNGGFNYESSQFNRAVNSSRQIGSTIKPLIYSIALENGFEPTTLLMSEQTTFNIENIGEYSPKNPNDKYANDKIDMIQAISMSDNIYALKTLLLLGSDNLVKLLNMFDIKDVNSLPSIALGTVSTSLLKLTSIYNTFASLGEYYKPKFISKVTDHNGNILYSSTNSYKTLLDTSNTIILNQMLTSTFDSSLSSYLNATMSNYKPDNIYAAKSGTTSTDSYVMAYNPNYTIGIWANIIDNNQKPSWYNTNHLTKALRYNPNTHSFDNSGSLYYFKK